MNQHWLKLGPETCVLHEPDFRTFSTYGTSPESPSGSLLAVTRFPQCPMPPGKRHAAEIWICDRNGDQAFKLAEVRNIDAHNGARVDWVDDGTLLYFDDAQAKVRRLDGTLLHAKPGLPGERTFGARVLVFQPDLVEPGDGLQVLDIQTGDFTPLLTRSQLKALGPGRLTHPRFSPDGRRIGFCLGEDFHSMEARPGACPVRFGPAPMHWLWFDADSIAGHTSSWGLGKRYALDGRELETLSGLGNHLAVSPDGQWIASETDYGSSPVVLTLFARGSGQGLQVFSSEHGATAWGLECHVNPSFARDGSRLYYVRPAGRHGMSAVYRTLTDARAASGPGRTGPLQDRGGLAVAKEESAREAVQ